MDLRPNHSGSKRGDPVGSGGDTDEEVAKMLQELLEHFAGRSRR